MAGVRSALIIASYEYADPGLRRLQAPVQDAEALAEVLGAPEIGGFEVHTVLNQPAHTVCLTVEDFFADRRPDDLLVLHFSGHGVKDEGGDLYFAAANTRLGRLGSTAVAADFVNAQMNRSRSRRVVLLLDCCYAGAFERGMVARGGSGIGIGERLGGRGRAVITSSTAMEYSFEAGELAQDSSIEPSIFTSALVEGLRTGEADRDLDGMISLDELYDYVYDRVREETPHQTPSKWELGFQGELYVARRSTPVTTPAPLPPELEVAVESPLAGVRVGAVNELERLLHARHAGLALAARLALEGLSGDDSRLVASAASAALAAEPQPVPVPAPEPEPLPRPEPVPQPEPQPKPEPMPQPEPLPQPEPMPGGEPPVEPQPLPDSVSAPGAGPRAGEHWLARLRRPLFLLAPLVLVVGVFVVIRAIDRPGSDEDGGSDGGSTPGLPHESVVAVESSSGELVAIDITTGSRRSLGVADVRLPTISPDRLMVVYLVDPPGEPKAAYAPWIMTIGENDAHPLIDDPSGRCAYTSRPAWHNANQQLAVSCLDAELDWRGLFIVGLDGKIQQKVPINGTMEGAPTWDDSGGIVYIRPNSRNDTSELWRVYPDRPGAEKLTDGGQGSDSHPDWSSDGTRLLFLRHPPDSEGDLGDIWVWESGEGEQPITDTGDIDSPTWAPDDQQIAFLTDRDAQVKTLWVMTPPQVESANPVDVGGEPVGPPAWGSR
jgi:uncharacterized caspase-like protein